MHRRVVDVMAELPGRGAVGSARLSAGMISVAGSLGRVRCCRRSSCTRTTAGAALARWRLDRADEVAGAGAVVLANVQQGNDASRANASRWADGWTGPAVSAPLTMLRRPPRATQFTVRDATVADASAVAAGHAGFTADHAFAHLWSSSSLGTGSPVPPCTGTGWRSIRAVPWSRVPRRATRPCCAPWR